MILLIIASLHGKISELTTMEDALTSTVFGRLRYIPHDKVLTPFLNSARHYSPSDCSFGSLGAYLANQKIHLEMYTGVSYKFWPKHPNHGEPDLILLFKGHQKGEPDLLILVEAKLNSSKSGTGEKDQLKRYYLAIHKSISDFNDRDISAFKGRVGPIIYLTKYSAQDEINESVQEITRTVKNLKEPIFHLNWQQLFDILATYHKQHGPSIICDDLMEYLQYLNLLEYKGISPPATGLYHFINSAPPVFYATRASGPKSYFANLPEINVNPIPNIFYRGARNG